ncbi:hypothetical protein ACA758_03810 [Mycoplasmopsis agassizii]|uniref:hypothetical protein n=1 Tax=Mycoplasmopsis agassizii TaxID=33922 RepID=UPI0035279BFE
MKKLNSKQKANLKKTALYSGIALASASIISAAAIIATQNNENVLLNPIKAENATISQNVTGGELKNSDVYFSIGEILDYQVEAGQYENIIANLNSFTGSSSTAKSQLLEIANNLRFYKLWKQIEANTPDIDVLNQWKALNQGAQIFNTLEEVITSQQNIQSLVAQLNGFTTGTKVSITGYGNTSSAIATPIAGAQLVNLSNSPSQNTSSSVTLNNEYNTLIKIGVIPATANEDIVLSFNRETQAVSGIHQGRLIIKATNGELNAVNTGSITQYDQNLNFFGRWTNLSNAELTTTNNSVMQTVDNFILSKTSTGYDLFVRALNQEKISDITIEAGGASLTQFGMLDAQLRTSDVKLSSNRIATTRFFSTSTVTSGTSDNQKFTVYLGNSATNADTAGFIHPIYLKSPNTPIDQNSYVRASDNNGADVNMVLQFSPQLVDGNLENPNLRALPENLNVVGAGGTSLNAGAITIGASIYQENAYAGFDINFSTDTFSFNTAKQNTAGNYEYDGSVVLTAEQYANKIFFEKPSTANPLQTLRTKTVPTVTGRNRNAEARQLLANVYQNWSTAGESKTAASTVFANNNLSLTKVVANRDSAGRYSNINLFGETSIFSGKGNELYTELVDANATLNAILNQLTGSTLQANVYTVANNNSVDIINNAFFGQLNATDTASVVDTIKAALEDETQTEDAIYNIAELQMGNLIKLTFDSLLTRVRDKLNLIYTSALQEFLAATTLTENRSFNTEFITYTENTNVRANLATNNVTTLSLFSRNNSVNSLTTNASLTGAALAKSYLDLIFTNQFGRTLYASQNSASLNTYETFAADYTALTDAEALSKAADAEKSNYLTIYSQILGIINLDWDNVLASYLLSGDAIDIKGTGLGENDTSFEKWFQNLNTALDSTSTEASSQALLSIYGKEIRISNIDNLITGANLYKSLQKRQEIEASVSTITDGQRTQLNRRLEENLTTLPVIANIALVTNNINPINYVTTFASSGQAQFTLAEQIINDFDLAKQVTYTTTDLQSALAVTAEQANPAFVGTLYALAIVFVASGIALIALRKRAIASLMTKTIKYVSYAVVAVGVLILIAAIVATILI